MAEAQAQNSPFSWGNFFTKKPDVQQQQNNPNPKLTNNDPNNQPNPANPASPQNTQTPFDAYANLWKNVDSKDTTPPPFDIDDKTVSGVADKLDFMAGYDEAELQGLRDHFGDKADSVFKLLNNVGRKAYSTALQHGSKVTGKYLDVRKGYDSKDIGKQIREHNVTNSIGAFEAAKKHPVIRQQLEKVGLELARQHPDADATWISEKTREYFDMMSSAFSPQEQTNLTDEQKKKAPGGQDFDWDEFSKAQEDR